MTVVEACRRVMESTGIIHCRYVASVLDTGDAYIVGTWEKYGQALLDNHGLLINKATGKIDYFVLLDDENFKILDKAVEMEVPLEFMAPHDTN